MNLLVETYAAFKVMSTVDFLVWHYLPNDTLKSALVPLDCLLLRDPMTGANPALRSPALRNTLAGPSHAAVEVHAVNADSRVVLDAQIDMLADAEAKVAGFGEVAGAEFVFFDFEATLENFLGLGTADSDMDGDFLIAANSL